jgi:heme oxygenase (biliverdin-IX-beta and delta-forming)
MQLNMTTRQWHADVDQPWLSLSRATVSRAEYLAQLVRIYGLVAPFESACKYTPRVERLAVRVRTGFIVQDLLSLGLSANQIATVPLCGSITTFRDIPEAAGWLYVVERSMLLQEGVRRHLTEHLPEVSNACSYLSAFDRARDHWPSVARMLDRIAAQPDAATGVLAAANAGFATMRQWFGAH